MIALPLLWGQALALLITQQFDWLWFGIIHLFGVLCQVYALYLNDYADEPLDRQNQSYWLSGGSRVIPEGHLTGRQLYTASFIALFGLLLISATGYALDRVWMPVLAGLAVALGWTYSLGPIKASYRGYGELHQAISCGLFLPLLAFYLQAGTFAVFPWWLLLPVVLIFFAGNMITALPDTTSDRIGGKLSYAVRHSEKTARSHACILLLSAYLLIVIVSSPWLAWQLTTLLVSCPAIGLVLYVYCSGLVRNADSSNHHLLKRFILSATASQIWAMLLWTILLFWRGLQSG